MPLPHTISIAPYLYLLLPLPLSISSPTSRFPPPAFLSSPRSKDLYHTCYCLSGLSVAQHAIAAEAAAEDAASGAEGPKDATLLRETHSAFNICADKADRALRYFARKPCDAAFFAGDE